MKDPVVVKFGGSAITVKDEKCTPRLEVIHRAIDVIADYRRDLVLLHGGGSYAHPFIPGKVRVNRFRGESESEIVSEVELNLDQLTRIIGVGLLLRHRAFVPIRPMSFLTLNDGDVARSFLGPVIGALDAGLIPLIHGDLAVDETGGFGVVSADRIASLFGEKLGVSRVLFGCDVDGIFEDNPKTSRNSKIVPEVNKGNYKGVLDGLEISSGDVTGGMRGKVLEALRLARRGVESYIFNLDQEENLEELLAGSSSIGTRFVAWKR